MMDRLGQLKKMAVRVVKDRALIHSFDPVSPEHTRANTLPVLVYEIHGDHAFFFDNTEAKKGAVNLMKKAPFIHQKLPEMALKVDERYQEDVELFSDMEKFTWGEHGRVDPKILEMDEEELQKHYKENPFVPFQRLKEALAAKESKTFYVPASEIEMLKEALEKDKDVPGFFTKMGDPDKISCLIFLSLIHI